MFAVFLRVWLRLRLRLPVYQENDPEAFFKGFSDVHYQMLALVLRTVESLFEWLDTFDDFMLGLGLLQLSFLGSNRASLIFNEPTKLVGFWAGVMFLLASCCGVWKEFVWSGDHVLWVYAEIGAIALRSVTGIFLLPTYFFMMGLG